LPHLGLYFAEEVEEGIDAGAAEAVLSVEGVGADGYQAEVVPVYRLQDEPWQLMPTPCSPSNEKLLSLSRAESLRF
jgi:hypothetical protein